GGGVVLNGIATGAYIGAGLGPGPRDGLMTGLAARGHSIRVVRTCIEVTVLVTGWLLGGTVGLGTVVYALGIGPIAHVSIPLLTVHPRLQRIRRATSASPARHSAVRSIQAVNRPLTTSSTARRPRMGPRPTRQA